MPDHPDHYALVVGIDDYPNYRSLQGAKQDAKDFAAWLLDRSTGGGLPKTNLKLLLSKKNPARPVHEDIDEALLELFEVTEAAPVGRLYVYFSGHGLARSNIGTDLCLAKWSNQMRGRALDSQDYLEVIMGCGRFREVIMLLDCCRIRKVRRRALPVMIDPPRPGDGAPGSRSFIGYATQFLNAAREAATEEVFEDDEDDSPIVRGHFTRALLDGLKGLAAKPTGGVTASRLKDYLDVNTQEIAKSAGHVQIPEVQNGLMSDPEPVFGSAKPPSNPYTTSVRVTFSADRTGDVVLEDGNLNEVRRGPVASGPWQFDLERGNYWLRDLGDGHERSIRVTGHKTEAIDVEF